jgi:hypothetical protein
MADVPFAATACLKNLHPRRRSLRMVLHPVPEFDRIGLKRVDPARSASLSYARATGCSIWSKSTTHGQAENRSSRIIITSRSAHRYREERSARRLMFDNANVGG